MDILLIRHAASTHNGRLQHPDDPLTALGVAQAEALNRSLKDRQLDVILTSPMNRARSTAKALHEGRSCPLHVWPILEEKRNGSFEGQVVSQQQWDALEGDFETRRAPGGESLLEARERARKALELIKSLPVQTVAVVSHGTFLRILIAEIKGLTLREAIFTMTLQNCSVTRACYDGTFRMIDNPTKGPSKTD